MSSWPKVLPNDDGIRPAGRPNQCFYCYRMVGEEHLRDCVVIKKKVRLSYTYEVEILVPHSWTPEEIENHRNNSTWCALNGVKDIENQEGCGCERFHAKFIRVVDDKPQGNEPR